MTTQLVEVPGMGPVEFPASMSDAEISAAIKKNLSPKQTGDIVSSSVIRGAAGLAGLPVDALNLLRTARNKAQGTNYPTFSGGSQDIVKGVEKVTGTPLYQPESTGGKLFGATIEGATSGGPFGLLGMASGAAGGLGGEAAGLATNNNPYARFVGSLLAGGVVGLLGSARSSTGTVLKNTLEGTTDDQFIAAQKLINEARARGITLTGPEALAQVKNSAMAPELGLQRVVEQSRGGGQQMAGVMSQRPDQNRRAFDGVLSKIGPQVDDPNTIAPRVNVAAQGFIDDARQAGNAAARPFYKAAEPELVPSMLMSSSQYSALTKNPAINQAINHVSTDPYYGVVGQPKNSIAVLDAAKKHLDDIASSAKQEGMNNKAMIASQSIDDILKTADNIAPDYAKARGIVEKNRSEIVTPLKQGTLGQLSEATTFPAQRQVLFPANPETLTPQAVRTTISQLRMKDPTAARDLTRQFLETQFDEVTQSLVKGGNEFGGAKFAAAITGNSKQAQNIRAAVESVGGKDALTGFNKFIQIMEAQGKRSPAGSATEFNKQITNEMAGGGLGNLVTKPLTTLGDWWEKFKYSGNSKELAQIFTDPQSVAKMRKLSMLGKDSPGARALATSIVVPITQIEE